MNLLYRIGAYLMARAQKSSNLPNLDTNELLLASHFEDMVATAEKDDFTIVTEQFLGNFEDDMQDKKKKSRNPQYPPSHPSKKKTRMQQAVAPPLGAQTHKVTSPSDCAPAVSRVDGP
ncbi:unnamed protein product [Caenorhabditis brenneri]